MGCNCGKSTRQRTRTEYRVEFTNGTTRTFLDRSQALRAIRGNPGAAMKEKTVPLK